MADRNTFAMSWLMPLRVNVQRRERLIDIAAANQIHHQAGLLRRGADVTCCRVCFNRHD